MSPRLLRPGSHTQGLLHARGGWAAVPGEGPRAAGQDAQQAGGRWPRNRDSARRTARQHAGRGLAGPLRARQSRKGTAPNPPPPQALQGCRPVAPGGARADPGCRGQRPHPPGTMSWPKWQEGLTPRSRGHRSLLGTLPATHPQEPWPQGRMRQGTPLGMGTPPAPQSGCSQEASVLFQLQWHHGLGAEPAQVRTGVSSPPACPSGAHTGCFKRTDQAPPVTQAPVCSSSGSSDTPHGPRDGPPHPSACVDACAATFSFCPLFRLLHSKPISWATGKIISPFKSVCADHWRVEDKTQTITREAFDATPVLDQTLTSPDTLTMQTGRGLASRSRRRAQASALRVLLVWRSRSAVTPAARGQRGRHDSCDGPSALLCFIERLTQKAWLRQQQRDQEFRCCLSDISTQTSLCSKVCRR